MEREDLPIEERYITYELWKSLINDKSKIVLELSFGFGGGGRQEFKYSSVDVSKNDYFINSFEFKRGGVDIFLGYELRKFVLGLNVGIEFWQTDDFKRILKEGDEYDEFQNN